MLAIVKKTGGDGEKPEMYPLRYIEDFFPAPQASSDGRSDFTAVRAFFITLLSAWFLRGGGWFGLGACVNAVYAVKRGMRSNKWE
jgi:hypothetical protein